MLPLDKEDFFIGTIDNYDSFISKNNIPTFKFDETSQWKEFYSENIESDNDEGSLASDGDFVKAIKSYTAQWDEYMTYIDKLLNQVIKSQDLLSAYIKDDTSYFAKAELNIASKITDVYEDLYTRKKALDITLFKNYATIQQEDEAPTMLQTLSTPLQKISPQEKAALPAGGLTTSIVLDLILYPACGKLPQEIKVI